MGYCPMAEKGYCHACGCDDTPGFRENCGGHPKCDDKYAQIQVEQIEKIKNNFVNCMACHKKIQGDLEDEHLVELQKYNLEKTGYTLMYCSNKCVDNFKKEHPNFKIPKEVETHMDDVLFQNEEHYCEECGKYSKYCKPTPSGKWYCFDCR